MPQRFRRSQRPEGDRRVRARRAHRGHEDQPPIRRVPGFAGAHRLRHDRHRAQNSVGADGNWDKPIGTGPYQFKEWKRGEYVLLTAFRIMRSLPGRRQAGRLRGRQARAGRRGQVPGGAGRVQLKAGLVSGAIDASQITNTDVAELKGNPAVAVMTPHDATKHTLLFQTQDPVLKNVKLRRPSPPRWIFRRSWRRRRKGWAS